MKHISAILTALIITAIIGFGITIVGVSALANKNTVPVQNSPGTSSSTSSDVNRIANNGEHESEFESGSSGNQSNQLEQLQQQLSGLQSQLNQESQAIQQYQSLLSALQQRGLIFIDQNGNIFLPQR